MNTPAWYWLISVWLLAIGGSIGSFMNVVVYRMPLGMSTVRPGSLCPVCRYPIRWHDNIPVLSWFLLGGRCRECKTHFSIRYAAIEALVAVLFLALGHFEGLRGGVNFPLGANAAQWDVPLDRYQSWGVCAYHLTLICSLICAALIQWDRGKMPFPLLLFVWTVGLAGPIVFPRLHPNLNHPTAFGYAFDPTRIAGLEYSLLGAMSGVALAAIAYGMGRGYRPSIDRWDVGFSGAVGVFLGWNAATCVVLLATAFSVICQWIMGQRLWIGCLTCLSLLWILVWKFTDHYIPLLGHAASWPTFVGAALCIVLISWFSTRSTV